MEWRPIETAPKDGVSVLIWSESYEGFCGVIVGRWDRVAQRFTSNDQDYSLTDYEDDEYDGNDEPTGRTVTHSAQPTYWMPLPAPPVIT